MPWVPAAAAAVGSVLGTAVWGSITVGNILAAAYVVGSAVEGRRRARAAAASARNSYFASLQDRSIMVRSAIAPRNLVYGRDRVSGPMVDCFKTGANEQFLHVIVALAGRPIDGVEKVYLNEHAVDLATDVDVDGYVTLPAWGHTKTYTAEEDFTVGGGGTVTLSRAASKVTLVGGYNTDALAYNDMVVGWSHTGPSATISSLTPTQQIRVSYEWTETFPRVRLHAILGDHTTYPAALLAETGGRRTTAHHGHDVPHIWARFEWDQEVFGQIGMPNISALVRGHKVADPRTSTTAWSENAALCTADYARDQALGLRCTSAQVPDAEVIAEANICDETVVLNAGGTITQARYTANGTLSGADGRLSNLDRLVEAMAGSAIWMQGRWRIRAGAHPTPEPITITVDHFAGAAELRSGAPRRELFNAVAATYRDPTANYTEVQAPPVTNATYEAEDGGRRITERLQLEMVQDAWRAQRLAKIRLERARQAESMVATFNARAYNLGPGMVVPVTVPRYGWSAKLFEVRGRTLDIHSGTIKYPLRATHASVWDWAYGEATAVDPAPNTDLPSPFTRPASLTGLSLTTGNTTMLRLSDGTIVARVLAEWDASTDAFVLRGGRIEVQWKPQATDVWASEAALEGTATSAMVGPMDEGMPVLVRVRAVNAAGRTSEWSTEAIVVLGKGAPPSNVLGFAVTIAPGIGTATWRACPDIDYRFTELRLSDANWGSDAPPPMFRGDTTMWQTALETAGTYNVYARHFDASGNYSAGAAMVTVTVGSGDIISGGAGTVYALRLTPPKITLDADASGGVASFASATSVATVWTDAGVDDTANGWSFAITPHGVAANLSGALNNTVNVTGWDSAVADPLWGQVKMLMQFSQSLSELKGATRWVHDRSNGATTYVLTSGDYEVELGDTTGSLSVGNWGIRLEEPQVIDLETGDLCMEVVATLRTFGGRPKPILSVIDVSAGQANKHNMYVIHYDTNGKWNIEVKTGAAANATTFKAGSTTVALNTRYHLALVRSGNNYDLWVNGVKETSTPITTAYRHTAGSRQILLGYTGWLFGTDGLDHMWGRLGLMRITSGTGAARYTSGTYTSNYTPPAGYAPGAFVDVVATKGPTSVANILLVELIRQAYNGGDGITASLDRASVIVQADTNGTVPAANLPININALVVRGGAAITGSYTGAVTTLPSGVTATYAAGVLSITAVTQAFAEGTLTLTLSRTGYPPIPLSIPMTKTRLLTPAGTQTNLAPYASYVGGTGTKTAGYRLNNDGTLDARDQSGAWAPVGNWYSPTTAGIGSSRWVNVSGMNTYSRANMDTWLSLSSGQTFDIVATAGQIQQADLRAQISNSNTGSPVIGETRCWLRAQGV